jgi:hypothetical protein
MQDVPAEGLEPTRPCGHWILSPARLPIPPRRRVQEHTHFARRHEHFDWLSTQGASRCFNITQSLFALLLDRKSSTQRDVGPYTPLHRDSRLIGPRAKLKRFQRVAA